MRRIRRQEQAEAIEFGLSLFPPELRRRVEGIDVFFGDPLAAGLHRDSGEAGKRPDGTPFTYLDAAHFTAPHFQEHRPASARRPTIVVPPGWEHRTIDPWDAVHEFAHGLDWLLGYPSRRLPLAPVSRYAGTNRAEGFAEAFAALFATSDSRLYGRESYLAFFRRWAPGFLAFVDAVASPERGFRLP